MSNAKSFVIQVEAVKCEDPQCHMASREHYHLPPNIPDCDRLEIIIKG